MSNPPKPILPSEAKNSVLSSKWNGKTSFPSVLILLPRFTGLDNRISSLVAVVSLKKNCLYKP